MVKITHKKFDNFLDKLVEEERKTNALPALSSLDKAKLDHEIAIEHLYYSSKIEGTTLNNTRIEKAIHGTSSAFTER
ncbi:hypothetical protein A2662_01975 [Candidatus Giovannonibacteria bacterium RIFCSPHIGHO2_01_FULL_45_33]|nr:MAG: hypothetical protein A2662_01975 [Candidatus Giovannonibacteria bacterium RIFCSPHIGHO2_01_FULL_45_33]